MSIEAEGDGVKWLAIMVSAIFISVSGCVVGVNYTHSGADYEKEKTNQLAIQWKMDSLNATKSK